MNHAELIRRTLGQGKGVLRLAPTWVPRPFNRPGRRIRLHPDDYFAMGMERGAIVERWFSSITHVETQGASPWNMSEDSFERNRISPIQMNRGSEVRAQKIPRRVRCGRRFRMIRLW